MSLPPPPTKKKRYPLFGRLEGCVAPNKNSGTISIWIHPRHILKPKDLDPMLPQSKTPSSQFARFIAPEVGIIHLTRKEGRRKRKEGYI